MTIPWRLTGTPAQQAITADALAKIKFPWERLALPGQPEIGWRDLNTRAHGTEDHAGEKGPEPLLGMVNGRRFTLGVFYPGSARIYLDNSLDQAQAEATVAAEVAHAVDEFLPMTDAQRGLIMLELHGGHADNHTWWEKNDYSAEYWSLIGETFMALFCKAYSDIPFGSTASFEHDPGRVSAETVRRIMGIERTDAAPPLPKPQYKHFAGSKVAHRLSHLPNKPGILVSTLTGYTLCKVCKPNGGA